MASAAAVNMSGLPAISVPVGCDSEGTAGFGLVCLASASAPGAAEALNASHCCAGMPIGLQIVAPAWEESRLLLLAGVLEQQLPRCPPPQVPAVLLLLLLLGEWLLLLHGCWRRCCWPWCTGLSSGVPAGKLQVLVKMPTFQAQQQLAGVDRTVCSAGRICAQHTHLV